MTQSFLSWIIKILPESNSFYSNYGNNSNGIEFLKEWFRDNNEKIKSVNGSAAGLTFDFDFYNEYFNFFKLNDLQSEFELKVRNDDINLKVLVIKSFLFESKNKKKAIVFCHGISNNK